MHEAPIARASRTFCVPADSTEAYPQHAQSLDGTLGGAIPLYRSSEEEKRVTVIKAPHYPGIGPVDESGIPTAIRTVGDARVSPRAAALLDITCGRDRGLSMGEHHTICFSTLIKNHDNCDFVKRHKYVLFYLLPKRARAIERKDKDRGNGSSGAASDSHGRCK